MISYIEMYLFALLTPLLRGEQKLLIVAFRIKLNDFIYRNVFVCTPNSPLERGWGCVLGLLQ
jgi:hypothetical protein